MKSEPKNTESKIGAPAPRANHTATYVDEHNKVYVIGGHGGVGYSRKAFDDIHSYDCETQEWSKIDPLGSAPRERGGHTANLLPNCNQIFIYGGWNSVTQFENFFIFDCDNKEWIDLDASNRDIPRWSHSAVMVPALPQWKLFIYGGSHEAFEEGTKRSFANLSNQAMYINIEGELKKSKWIGFELEDSEELPQARENASMVYDEHNNRLVIFGGWSNKYMDDIYELNISSITGPQYAIYDINPIIGPYTGNTRCTITGEGFVPHSTYFVEFTVPGKPPQTAQADYISETIIECPTPNFKAANLGPRKTEVKVRANKGDLTLTSVNFEFFLNTIPSNTIAFGPGLLENNSTKCPTMFYIQARNKDNKNRDSGKDDHKIEVFIEKEVTKENEEGESYTEIEKTIIPHEVKDNNNGQYEVSYQFEEEGEVFIDIQMKNEENKLKSIRGAPFSAKFDPEAPEENNKFTGPNMVNYVTGRLGNISSFIRDTTKGIDTSKDKFKNDRKALLKIKEKHNKSQQREGQKST